MCNCDKRGKILRSAAASLKRGQVAKAATRFNVVASSSAQSVRRVVSSVGVRRPK